MASIEPHFQDFDERRERKRESRHLLLAHVRIISVQGLALHKILIIMIWCSAFCAPLPVMLSFYPTVLQ